jgi:hypothetical protein
MRFYVRTVLSLRRNGRKNYLIQVINFAQAHFALKVNADVQGGKVMIEKKFPYVLVAVSIIAMFVSVYCAICSYLDYRFVKSMHYTTGPINANSIEDTTLVFNDMVDMRDFGNVTNDATPATECETIYYDEFAATSPKGGLLSLVNCTTADGAVYTIGDYQHD